MTKTTQELLAGIQTLVNIQERNHQTSQDNNQQLRRLTGGRAWPKIRETLILIVVTTNCAASLFMVFLTLN